MLLTLVTHTPVQIQGNRNHTKEKNLYLILSTNDLSVNEGKSNQSQKCLFYRYGKWKRKMHVAMRKLERHRFRRQLLNGAIVEVNFVEM